MEKTISETYGWRTKFIVRIGGHRYLQLDAEGEAERIEDAHKATTFDTYKAAQKAAWAFQAEPFEPFVVEQMVVLPCRRNHT